MKLICLIILFMALDERPSHADGRGLKQVREQLKHDVLTESARHMRTGED